MRKRIEMGENCVSAIWSGSGFLGIKRNGKERQPGAWIKGGPSVEVGSLTFFSQLLLVLVRSGVAQSALDAVATIAVASMLFWATGILLLLLCGFIP
jgi:hypothetical protein